MIRAVHLRAAAMVTFLLLFFGLVYAQKTRLPEVLVIHSYAPDYSWVPSLNEGIARAFEARPDVQVRYHYMDLKNHTDDDFRRTATRLAVNAVREMRPDVIILLDDVAQDLVGRRFASGPDSPAPESDPTVQIVFGGVNDEPDAYYAGKTNVTGIKERKPLPAIRDTLLTLIEAQDRVPTEREAGFDAAVTGTGRPSDPTGYRVQFIGDFSPSITKEIPFYNAFEDWAPIVWLPPVQVETFDEWKAAVRAAEGSADMILLTNYQQIHATDADSPFVRPAAQVMQWTEANAPVPVLGLGYSNGEDGAMLTVSVSPYEQGEMAARLALDIFDGAAAQDLPMLDPHQFIVHMCQTTLDRREVRVPVFYEAFARATDHFYDQC